MSGFVIAIADYPVIFPLAAIYSNTSKHDVEE